MTVSLSQTPAYATVKTKAKIAFSVSASENWVRLWVTAAPDGSEFKTLLQKAGAGRVEVFAGDTTQTFEFAPEVGGVYQFAVQGYTKGATAGFSGGYKGDRRGFATETQAGSEATVSIAIGQRGTTKLGTGSDTATLVVYGFGDRIRPTTFDVHGEVSPAVIDPSSPKAKTAAADASVLSGAAALSDSVWSTALGTLATVATNIIQKFNAHLTQGGVHNANDGTNGILRSYESATTPEALKRSVSEILRRLDLHMRNDDGTAVGTGAASYHVVGGVNRADWAAALIAQPPGDIAGCAVALADAWRAFEAHRVSAGGSGVHSTADTTNTLTALSPLLLLHKAFLASLQATSPTVPNTANASVVGLTHGAGFTFE